jgi:hypothetical protein
MSRIYELSCHSDQIIQQLKEGKLKGLKHVYKPKDALGGISLWPDGITDETNNSAWFEDNMILVWGTNDITNIQTLLNENGITLRYIG